MGKQKAHVHNSSQKKKEKKIDKSSKLSRSTSHEGYLKSVEAIVQAELESSTSIKRIDRKWRKELERYPLLAKAVYLNCNRAVDTILEAGGNVNVQIPDGSTPLMIAIENECPDIVSKLLENGADPKLLRQDGRNSLMIAISKNDNRSFTLIWNYWEKINFWELNHTDLQGYTALTIAVVQGNIEMINFLLNLNGVEINKQTKEGKTALMFAVSGGQTKTVQKLLACGSDFTLEDKNVTTALCLAISKNHTEIRDILLECLDVKSRDAYVKKRIDLLTNPREEGSLKTVSFFTDILFHVILEIRRQFEDGIELLEKYKVLPCLLKCMDAHQQDTELLRTGFHVTALLLYEKGKYSSYSTELAEEYVKCKFSDFALKIMQNYRLKSMSDLRSAAFLSIHAGTHCCSGKTWLIDNYYQILPFVKEFKFTFSTLNFWEEGQNVKAKIMFDRFMEIFNQIEQELKDSCPTTPEAKATASEGNSLVKTTELYIPPINENEENSTAADNQQWCLVSNSKSSSVKTVSKHPANAIFAPTYQKRGPKKKNKAIKLQTKIHRKIAEKKPAPKPNLRYTIGYSGCIPVSSSKKNLTQTCYADILKRNLNKDDAPDECPLENKKHPSKVPEGCSVLGEVFQSAWPSLNSCGQSKEKREVDVELKTQINELDNVDKKTESVVENKRNYESNEKEKGQKFYDLWYSPYPANFFSSLINFFKSNKKDNEYSDQKIVNKSKSDFNETIGANEYNEKQDSEFLHDVFAAQGLKIVSVDTESKSEIENKDEMQKSETSGLRNAANNVFDETQTVQHMNTAEIPSNKDILETSKAKASKVKNTNTGAENADFAAETNKENESCISTNLSEKICTNNKFETVVTYASVLKSGQDKVDQENAEKLFPGNDKETTSKNQSSLDKAEFSQNKTCDLISAEDYRLGSKLNINETFKEKETISTNKSSSEKAEFSQNKTCDLISAEDDCLGSKLNVSETFKEKETISNNKSSSEKAEFSQNKTCDLIFAEDGPSSSKLNCSKTLNRKKSSISFRRNSSANNSNFDCNRSIKRKYEEITPQNLTINVYNEYVKENCLNDSNLARDGFLCCLKQNDIEIRLLYGNSKKYYHDGSRSKFNVCYNCYPCSTTLAGTQKAKISTAEKSSLDTYRKHFQISVRFPLNNEETEAKSVHVTSAMSKMFDRKSNVCESVVSGMLSNFNSQLLDEKENKQYSLIICTSSIKGTQVVSGVKFSSLQGFIMYQRLIFYKTFGQLLTYTSRNQQQLSKSTFAYPVENEFEKLYKTARKHYPCYQNSQKLKSNKSSLTIQKNCNLLLRLKSEFLDFYSACFLHSKNKFRKQVKSVGRLKSAASKNLQKKQRRQIALKSSPVYKKLSDDTTTAVFNKHLYGYKPEFINCESDSQWYKLLHRIESCIPMNSFFSAFVQPQKSCDCSIHELICASGRIVFSSKEEHVLKQGEYKTCLGIMSNGNPVVIREFQKTARAIAELLSVRRRLTHKNIAMFYCVCDSPKAQKIFAVSELIEYSLPQYMKTKMVHFDGKHLVQELIDAIQYLHTNQIIHGFLKPSNIMVTIYHRLKVAGFCQLDVTPLLYGIVSNQGGTYGAIGSGNNLSNACWRPYELIAAESETEARKHLTTASDIQMCGMLIYYILSGGKHPFGSTDLQCQKNIRSGFLTFGSRPSDMESRDLVQDMIKQLPFTRLNINQAAKHPYLWSTHKRFLFLLAVSKQIDFFVRKPIKFTESLQDSCIESHDWTCYIHSRLLTYISKSMNKSYVNNYADFMHFIVSINDNFEMMPPEMKSLVHHPSVYILRTFPTIFMSVYCVIRSNPDVLKQMSLQTYF